MRKFYICPVCADFFDHGGIYHCLRCDHHYPSNHGWCKNCSAKLSEYGLRVITTDLEINEIITCGEWSDANKRRRGTWELITPETRLDKFLESLCDLVKYRLKNGSPEERALISVLIKALGNTEERAKSYAQED